MTTAAVDRSRESRRRRGFLWWFGVAAVVLVGLFGAAFIWGLFETSVPEADKAAAARAVEAKTNVADGRASCIGRGTATCLVQVQKGATCQEWIVRVRHGQAVSRPRWMATVAC